MKELILGGARSGKSQLAEQRALASGLTVVYLATAQALDGEMARRVAHHRERRPADWGCVEETLHLAARLRELAAPDTCVLVDCLTLWLSNLLFAGKAAAQAEAGEAIACPLVSPPQSPSHARPAAGFLIRSVRTGPGVAIVASQLSRR